LAKIDGEICVLKKHAIGIAAVYNCQGWPEKRFISVEFGAFCDEMGDYTKKAVREVRGKKRPL